LNSCHVALQKNIVCIPRRLSITVKFSQFDLRMFRNAGFGAGAGETFWRLISRVSAKNTGNCWRMREAKVPIGTLRMGASVREGYC
jgi:hypothetical protein